MPIKVALMGLGAIGRGIARCALQKSELEIVAAIDLDPSRVGKKLSDVLDAPAPDVIVGSDAAAEMKKAQGGVDKLREANIDVATGVLEDEAC